MASRREQVQRTRRLVLDAFAGLLVDVPYEEIRVGRLAERAGVSRQSFYRLFGTKDRVLTAYFERLFDEFEAEALRHRGEGANAPYRALFGTLGAHAHELRVFGQPRLRGILFEALWHYQARLLEHAPGERAAAPEPHGGTALVTYQSGGIAALAMEWIERGMVVPAGEVADLAADAAVAFRDRPEYLPALLARRQAALGPGADDAGTG
ncbi:TetR/AcrR family transcriptional regulator [Propionicicella superfundia]|uniref:TetR/AcrR family transcriptional regulator n=1 Tax=Propionicicella superfundia TaxID=348582 RepID=UPI0003F97DD8|nr:TetR/AcrR family transcriptional regulator [Propionicicella superfundia]